MTENEEDNNNIKTKISPEQIEELKKIFIDSFPKDMHIIESAADLEFLKGCVVKHIEKLKALSNRLPKEEWHTIIELVSIRTELEISLHIINEKK